MLLGYKEITGEIEFLFTDDAYLKKQFPNNSAKISNFWKTDNHGLKEYFVNPDDFPDFYNYKNYKIIGGKIIKKSDEEIAQMQPKKPKILKIDNLGMGGMKVATMDYVKNLEERIKKLENQ